MKKLKDKSLPKNDNEQKFVNIFSCLLPLLDFFLNKLTKGLCYKWNIIQLKIIINMQFFSLFNNFHIFLYLPSNDWTLLPHIPLKIQKNHVLFAENYVQVQLVSLHTTGQELWERNMVCNFCTFLREDFQKGTEFLPQTQIF